jgi:hypothetical protein
MALKNSNSITNKMVDIAREERTQKADAIIEVFNNIISNPKFIEAKEARPGSRLHELANNLDTDLDFFTMRIQ